MDLLTLGWSSFTGSPNEDERCGVVLNNGDIIELLNESSYPLNSFSMSEEQVAPYKDTMVATWHTHPRGPGNLSIEDYNTFLALPEYHHLIISHRSVSLYKAELEHVMNVGRRIFDV